MALAAVFVGDAGGGPLTCFGLEATITVPFDVDGNEVSWVGTDGDDVIIGGPENDTIMGEEGNDLLCGRGGRDLILGGGGDDQIRGGSGRDEIGGGDGNDVIAGRSGRDRLEGDDGDDLIRGGPHSDYIRGGDGEDILKGGPEVDELYGGRHDDQIFGNSTADYLVGGTGSDLLNGGSGRDMCVPGDDGFHISSRDEQRRCQSHRILIPGDGTYIAVPAYFGVIFPDRATANEIPEGVYSFASGPSCTYFLDDNVIRALPAGQDSMHIGLGATVTFRGCPNLRGAIVMNYRFPVDLGN